MRQAGIGPSQVGEGGPPSNQEAAQLRELLSAAETMTEAAREHRVAATWQRQQQP